MNYLLETITRKQTKRSQRKKKKKKQKKKKKKKHSKMQGVPVYNNIKSDCV